MEIKECTYRIEFYDKISDIIMEKFGCFERCTACHAAIIIIYSYTN